MFQTVVGHEQRQVGDRGEQDNDGGDESFADDGSHHGSCGVGDCQLTDILCDGKCSCAIDRDDAGKEVALDMRRNQGNVYIGEDCSGLLVEEETNCEVADDVESKEWSDDECLLITRSASWTCRVERICGDVTYWETNGAISFLSNRQRIVKANDCDLAENEKDAPK